MMLNMLIMRMGMRMRMLVAHQSFAVHLRRVQGGPRVHRGLHLPQVTFANINSSSNANMDSFLYSMRSKESSQVLNEELFHKLTGGWT